MFSQLALEIFQENRSAAPGRTGRSRPRWSIHANRRAIPNTAVMHPDSCASSILCSPPPNIPRYTLLPVLDTLLATDSSFNIQPHAD